jgi:fatty-acyl-CoA synthase
MYNYDDITNGGTLGDFILSAVQRFPNRIAFVSRGQEFSYREVGAGISKVIEWFSIIGLSRGDAVAQISNNVAEQWIVMAAAYMSGLRSVTLHAKASLDDQAYIINDSEAKAVIVSGNFTPSVGPLESACGHVRTWACHDEWERGPSLWQACSKLTGAKLEIRTEPEEIIRLAYTGGTTGRPKGVMLSNRSLVANTFMNLAEKGWPEEVRVLCAAPISHGAGGMIVPTLFRGGTIFLHEAFDPEHFLTTIEREKITVAYTVPTMLYKLLDHPASRTADLSSLRLITYGASPMSPARLKDAIAVFGPILSQGYGQTEAPASITNLRPVDHETHDDTRLWSCGRPYPGIRVAILDDNNDEVPNGSVGEVCVRGPIVMSGYWKMPEETAEAFRGNWLHTGDMGYFDDEGYLYLVDRKKDMIISGGFNVYPREIEDVLFGHPDVASAAVIGVPDPKWGEAVVAIVVAKHKDVKPEDLKELVRARKGAIYTPKHIEIVSDLPMTPVGKPDKKKLRERYWNVDTRQIG